MGEAMAEMSRVALVRGIYSEARGIYAEAKKEVRPRRAALCVKLQKKHHITGSGPAPIKLLQIAADTVRGASKNVIRQRNVVVTLEDKKRQNEETRKAEELSLELAAFGEILSRDEYQKVISSVCQIDLFFVDPGGAQNEASVHEIERIGAVFASTTQLVEQVTARYAGAAEGDSEQAQKDAVELQEQMRKFEESAKRFKEHLQIIKDKSHGPSGFGAISMSGGSALLGRPAANLAQSCGPSFDGKEHGSGGDADSSCGRPASPRSKTDAPGFSIGGSAIHLLPGRPVVLGDGRSPLRISRSIALDPDWRGSLNRLAAAEINLGNMSEGGTVGGCHIARATDQRRKSSVFLQRSVAVTALAQLTDSAVDAFPSAHAGVSQLIDMVEQALCDQPLAHFRRMSEAVCKLAGVPLKLEHLHTAALGSGHLHNGLGDITPGGIAGGSHPHQGPAIVGGTFVFSGSVVRNRTPQGALASNRSVESGLFLAPGSPRAGKMLPPRIVSPTGSFDCPLVELGYSYAQDLNGASRRVPQLPRHRDGMGAPAQASSLTVPASAAALAGHMEGNPLVLAGRESPVDADSLLLGSSVRAASSDSSLSDTEVARFEEQPRRLAITARGSTLEPLEQALALLREKAEEAEAWKEESKSKKDIVEQIDEKGWCASVAAAGAGWNSITLPDHMKQMLPRTVPNNPSNRVGLLDAMDGADSNRIEFSACVPGCVADVVSMESSNSSVRPGTIEAVCRHRQDLAKSFAGFGSLTPSTKPFVAAGNLATPPGDCPAQRTHPFGGSPIYNAAWDRPVTQAHGGSVIKTNRRRQKPADSVTTAASQQKGTAFQDTSQKSYGSRHACIWKSFFVTVDQSDSAPARKRLAGAC